MEFKIGDQVLLHYTKAKKQWSRKFDPKNRLKIYHVKQQSLLSVHQLGTQIPLIRPEDIPQDLEPIIVIKIIFFNVDFSDQILQLLKQLFDAIQQSSAQIEITIDKKEIQYRDKNKKEVDGSSTRTKLSHPYKQTSPYKRKRKGNTVEIEPNTAKKKGKETEMKLCWVRIEKIREGLNRQTPELITEE
ncbi:hypothetical protein G9A89_013371 [Geosiphon pyriformis]|nr:hypothetical protein G9A89_013371 [Geosiphon pyriformis]